MQSSGFLSPGPLELCCAHVALQVCFSGMHGGVTELMGHVCCLQVLCRARGASKWGGGCSMPMIFAVCGIQIFMSLCSPLARRRCMPCFISLIVLVCHCRRLRSQLGQSQKPHHQQLLLKPRRTSDISSFAPDVQINSSLEEFAPRAALPFAIVYIVTCKLGSCLRGCHAVRMI